MISREKKVRIRLKLSLLAVLCWLMSNQIPAQTKPLRAQTEEALTKGIEFFHYLNSHGGYVYHYSLDGSQRWGEVRANLNTIEVQPPGTPAVGAAFLKAYLTTKNKKFLKFAEEAALALARGQNKFGGWEHTIDFSVKRKKPRVSFDDNQTQSALSFLLSISKVTANDSIISAKDRALKLMLVSQMKSGGWPHKYPKQGNYHDLATFNDATINNCISVLIQAYRSEKRRDIESALLKAGDFIINSQYSEEQPGWAQQYDENLNPAWARSFEPASLSCKESIQILNTLMELYDLFGEKKYLQPIQPAIHWLERTKLKNGLFPRFVELGTNQPLYYDRGRKRVNSVEELSAERRLTYGYEQDLQRKLDKVKIRFNLLKEGRTLPRKVMKLSKLEKKVKKIIESQDEYGRWITKDDKFQDKSHGKLWNGVFSFMDRLNSSVTNENVNLLCEFLERTKN